MRSTDVLKRVMPVRAQRAADQSGRPPLIRELLIVIPLFLLYKYGRKAANGQFQEAFDNARFVWDLERALYLPSEEWVQDVVLHSETAIRAINVYYATVHFPATAIFLIWMFWRRPLHYVWIRWVLIWLTGAALVLHLLVPLAPPRLFRASGLIDTSAVYGPKVYDKPDPDSLANQFAAMPSLHVGWAVVIALALIVATRTRLRWLWLLHPMITVLAVVSTGHHYWMDGIVAVTILSIVLVVLRPPPRALAGPPSATGRARRTRPDEGAEEASEAPAGVAAGDERQSPAGMSASP